MDGEDNGTRDNTENIRIFSTEDEKIKYFGELLTNDSSRAILQILMSDEQTASQLAQRTGLSLPLVIYHLNKMQALDVIKVSRIETNVKGQDMKHYRATKFAIVILPSTVSEKAIKSKSLIRSFKSIYRFAGIGVAGAAAWLGSASLQRPKLAPVPDTGDTMAEIPLVGESADVSHETSESAESPAAGDAGAPPVESADTSEPAPSAESPEPALEAAEPAAVPDTEQFAETAGHGADAPSGILDLAWPSDGLLASAIEALAGLDLFVPDNGCRSGGRCRTVAGFHIQEEARAGSLIHRNLYRYFDPSLSLPALRMFTPDISSIVDGSWWVLSRRIRLHSIVLLRTPPKHLTHP